MTGSRRHAMEVLVDAAGRAPLDLPGTILAFVRGLLARPVVLDFDAIAARLEAANVTDGRWRQIADDLRPPPPAEQEREKQAAAGRRHRAAFAARHGLRL